MASLTCQARRMRATASITSAASPTARYAADMSRRDGGLPRPRPELRSIVICVALLAAGCTTAPAHASVAPDADIPLRQGVESWAEAATLAGVPLYAPPADLAGEPTLEVRGVAGDPTRPVWATYDDGLRMIQAHRDVLPAPDDPAEFFPVPGADEAWRGDAGDQPYVLIRRGDTLILLSGAADELMVRWVRPLPE